MRRGLLIAAVLVVAIGLGVIAYTQVTVVSIPIPEDPSAEIVQGFHVVGPATASLHWSGGSSSSVVFAFRCVDAACVQPGTPIVNGTGASGTLHFAILASGVYEFNTSGAPVNGTITVSGFTDLGVIGGILAGAGVVLAAWSFRRPRHPVDERGAADVN